MRSKAICMVMITIGLSQHVSQNWSEGLAYVIPESRWEVGLFQPVKYGFSSTTEISIHPLAMIKLPNVRVKHVWKKQINATWSSVHGLYYPTPLLNFIAREGTGGLVSPEIEFPAAILSYNEARVTRPLSDNVFLTGKSGLGIGLAFGELDDRSTVDFPLIYQRLSALYNGFYLRIGADIQYQLSEKLLLIVDDDLFIMANSNETIGFEHKGLVVWNKSDRFSLTVGYKVVFGQYPFGPQWNIMPPHIQLLPVWIPLFDMQWGW